MKKIILTGGGTAGHITPNIALVPGLKQAGFEIYYIGLLGGMEEKLVEKLDVTFYGISGGKMRRYIDIKNVTDLFKISKGFFQAKALIKKLRPDVVFSKGGFVSTPVVWAARSLGVPVVSHESDMTIGLANKLAMPFVKKICYNFPETKASIPENKGVHTGLPIRSELLLGIRARGLSECGFNSSKPVIVAIGGSQGSQFINNLLRTSLDGLLNNFQVCHLCGKGNLDEKFDNREGYRQFEYVNEKLPDIIAMADVVVTRGGATSLFELLALKKPHVIIPYSLKASRGDQIINAASFKKQGFSEVLPEDELDMKTFINTLIEVYNNKNRYIATMEKSDARNGLENVLKVIFEVAGV